SAAENDRKDCAKVLLENGANPNISAKGGCMPLHLAAEHGDIELVKELLRRNANINSANAQNVTALHLAVERGNTDIVKELLKDGSFINISSMLIPDINSSARSLLRAKGGGHTPLS